jgi:hypothetical protein
MNRRSFLRAIGGVAIGVAATDELLEALAPKRTIFLPPRSAIRLDRSLYFDIESIIRRDLDRQLRESIDKHMVQALTNGHSVSRFVPIPMGGYYHEVIDPSVLCNP